MNTISFNEYSQAILLQLLIVFVAVVKIIYHILIKKFFWMKQSVH